MEIKEVALHSGRNDYADICVYIKKIETINLAQLYRALTSYLSILILPDAEQYLSVYEEHLANPYSWLNKAQTLSQAEAHKESLKAKLDAATSTMDKTLWGDSAKKLNYLIESWDADVYTVCQQIIQGIAMLIHEHIPLSDVQGEIIEFAKGRNVTGCVLRPNEGVTQKLQHLLCDAQVNSSAVLTKLARTVSLQADLFLNRLVQSEVSFDNLDTRQSFLFEANYKLCEFIETHVQHLKASLGAFPEKMAERISMRLNRITIDTVLERYKTCLLSSAVEENDVAEENNVWVEPEEIAFFPDVPSEPTQQDQERSQVPAPELTSASSSHVTHEKLETLLVASEQLLETVIKQVSLHRLQLSCSSRVKACYGKFSLFPLFRNVATKLTHYHTTLADSLSELTSMFVIAKTSESLEQRFSALMEALENSLARINTYLNTLNVHHEDYSVIDEIPSWQSKLHDLILGSSEEDLVLVDARLQRIESMDSPYLRATLIMKLDSAKLKLNDMIIANMQSWSSRLVDRETVENTLGYLGIRIHPSHLNKIAPNISIPKKRTAVNKDFYSIAADYSIKAWRNIRAWLDKQAIN